MTFAIWITGLPSSGKSTIAKELIKKLKKSKINFICLRLDKIRKQIVKKPKYTEKERDFVYKAYADKGIGLIKKTNVVFDATAHKLKYRDYARKRIKNFIEVYVKCPLKVCIERESKRKEGFVVAQMYKKALERKRNKIRYKYLGQVIGVDVPYEENKKAEIIINSYKVSAKKAADIIFDMIKPLI